MADLAQVAQTVAVAARGPAAGLLDRLCSACVQALPVEGAAIAMMADGDHPVVRSASDERVTRLEELQFTLGEGPGVAAFHRAAPMLAPDLLGADHNWPVFAAEAADLVQRAGWEIRSMLAFPLQAGRELLGVLDLYHRQSGEMDSGLLAQARIAVDAVVMALLAVSSPDADGSPVWLQQILTDQVNVDQAVGMVMAQLDLDPDQALARMRAHAFAHGRTVDQVARAVIARELRFHREDQ